MCEPPLAFLMSKLRANLEELNNREKSSFYVQNRRKMSFYEVHLHKLCAKISTRLCKD